MFVCLGGIWWWKLENWEKFSCSFWPIWKMFVRKTGRIFLLFIFFIFIYSVSDCNYLWDFWWDFWTTGSIPEIFCSLVPAEKFRCINLFNCQLVYCLTRKIWKLSKVHRKPEPIYIIFIPPVLHYYLQSANIPSQQAIPEMFYIYHFFYLSFLTLNVVSVIKSFNFYWFYCI